VVTRGRAPSPDWQPRTPDVEGPNEFFAQAELDGVLNFQTPCRWHLSD